jgi:hypothetical protein
MEGFKGWCGLLSIQGVIDYTHIHIQKPKGLFVAKFFSYKSKDYIMQLLVVVDHKKQFQDIFVGLLGSMNNLKIL